MKAVNQRHFIGVDLYRFSAATLVMLFHYGYLLGHMGDRGYAANGFLVSYPELASMTFSGFIGVQIFFVISGFVIAYSGEKSTARSFAISRIVRLWPGVLICGTFTLLVSLCFGKNDSLTEILVYLRSMIFFPYGEWVDSVYWTLGVEISFYFCVWYLISISRFKLIKFFAIAIGLLSSTFWLASIFGITGHASAMNAVQSQFFLQPEVQFNLRRTLDLLLMHHGMYFAIGVLLYIDFIQERSNLNRGLIGLFIITGCLQIYGQTRGFSLPPGVSDSFTYPILLWLIAIFLFVISLKLNNILLLLPANLLASIRTLGLMTFPLYLLHMVAGSTLMGILFKIGFNRWTILALTIALLLLLSWIVARYLEPPLQRKIKLKLEKVYS